MQSACRTEQSALQEQLEYYRARAAEYDEWWLRQGRYDRGPELNERWFADCRQAALWLQNFQPAGRVLELACGTGIWSEKLLAKAEHLTVVDGSPEMLAIAERRLGSRNVRYIQSDIFEWEPVEKYDVVFFGFWLSHVPLERFDAFWTKVERSLSPHGRFFFVDSRYEQTSTASNHVLPNREATRLRRRLNDGREYQIYKVFHEPSSLAQRLRLLGWKVDVRETQHYFLVGCGGR